MTRRLASLVVAVVLLPECGGRVAASAATADAGDAGTPILDAGDAGECPDGVHVPSTGQCTSDGWCWTNPSPQGGDLYAVFGSGATDVWSVGLGGTILHGDGQDWSLAGLVGNGNTLRGGWAASPCDAWAVGD